MLLAVEVCLAAGSDALQPDNVGRKSLSSISGARQAGLFDVGRERMKSHPPIKIKGAVLELIFASGERPEFWARGNWSFLKLEGGAGSVRNFFVRPAEFFERQMECIKRPRPSPANPCPPTISSGLASETRPHQRFRRIGSRKYWPPKRAGQRRADMPPITAGTASGKPLARIHNR